MDNFSLQIGCKEIVSYLQEGKTFKQSWGGYGQNCLSGCKAPMCLWKWDTKGCPGCPEVTPTPLSKFASQRRLQAEKYTKAQLMAAPAGSDYSDNDQGLQEEAKQTSCPSCNVKLSEAKIKDSITLADLQ